MDQNTTAFEMLQGITDNELADKGVIHLSERIFLNTSAICGLDARPKDGVLFVRTEGRDIQIDRNDTDRVLKLLLRAYGFTAMEEAPIAEQIEAPLPIESAGETEGAVEEPGSEPQTIAESEPTETAVSAAQSEAAAGEREGAGTRGETA